MIEEHFDIYNQNNEPLGISKPRSEVHAQGHWHRAVHIWILNSKNEFLIQKRASIKQSYPDLWDISSAGHISAGESSELSAVRELQEELGVQVEPSEFKYLFAIVSSTTQHNETYIDNEYNMVYLVRKDLDIDDLVLRKEEVSEVAWMPVSKLEELAKHGDSHFVSHPEEYKKLYEAIKAEIQ